MLRGRSLLNSITASQLKTSPSPGNDSLTSKSGQITALSISKVFKQVGETVSIWAEFIRLVCLDWGDGLRREGPIHKTDAPLRPSGGDELPRVNHCCQRLLFTRIIPVFELPEIGRLSFQSQTPNEDFWAPGHSLP